MSFVNMAEIVTRGNGFEVKAKHCSSLNATFSYEQAATDYAAWITEKWGVECTISPIWIPQGFAAHIR